MVTLKKFSLRRNGLTRLNPETNVTGRLMQERRKRTTVMALVLAALMTLAIANVASAQNYEPPRCIGGCDAEYPITYDAQAMWATYGYPTYYNGCWWYMCPKVDFDLHALEVE